MKLRFLPRMSRKVLVSLAVTLATLGVVGAVSAWSPDRPTYTVEHPAPHVTFNSITNNADYGDERTFFDVKDAANVNRGGYTDKVTAQDGQELLLRVYVHNNAADNLNGTNLTGPGVAKNTKVRIQLPTDTAQALRANAYVSADNAQPQIVADTIDLMGQNGGNFNVEYIPGSAMQYTNAVPTGMKLSDSIVTTGAPIGYSVADGIVPGCFQYSSYVTVKVKVKAPSYSIQKTVRHEGETSADWKETIKAEAGKNVEWRVEFKNIGSTELKQVKVVDQVPAGLVVVPGSVKLYNGNYPNGYTFPDSAIQSNGKQVNVNIGNYKPGINAFVLFKTKVPETKDLECGVNKFDNLAYATPEGLGAVNDGANVTVDGKDCKPTNPSYSCDLVTVKELGGRKISVKVNASATNGAQVVNYTYDFGDGSTKLVTDKDTVEYTYAKDGSYAVRVTVNVKVDGKNVTVDSNKCAAAVKFESGKPVTPVTPTTPTTSTLPNTGAGDVFGIVAAVTVAGAMAHRLVLARRNG